MSKIRKFLYLLLLCITVCLVEVKAQEDPPDEPPPVQTPIDGGAVFLLAAGVAYGVKQLFKVGKKNNN